MLPDQPVAVRTPTIIGRADVLETIRAAIAGDQREAIFFIGQGGIGKTRLLEEVGPLVAAFQGRPLCQSGIIDIYHAHHHSADGLRMAVANGLDPENCFFAEYRRSWQTYSERLAAGVGSDHLRPLYNRQEEQFREDYAALAQDKRIVLCFDTVELIQYESDLVQQLCQVEDDTTAIKSWFLQQATSLPNTVILLAGRPQPRIQTEFRRAFETAKWQFVERHLETFTEAEQRAYIEALIPVLRPEQQASLAELLEPGRQRWLSVSTGGQPIRLMIYLELLCSDKIPQPLREADAALPEEELDQALFDVLRQSQLAHPSFNIDYLYRARKGLDLQLLRHLAGATIPEEELGPTLRELTRFGFVKYRYGPGAAAGEAADLSGRNLLLFLHDELYDRYDRYFANKPEDRFEYQSYVNYYREAAAGAGGAEREDPRLPWLYYELQLSPSDGFYTVFMPLNNDAIQTYDVSLDIKLRDEVLRFFNRYARPGTEEYPNQFYDPAVADSVSQAEVDRDSAVRWVMRHFTRRRYPVAIAVAETLYTSQHPSLSWGSVNDPLYKAGLLTEWALALLLNGATEEECLPKLEAASSLLLEEQRVDARKQQLYNRIIGRAFNHIGYLHRNMGRHGQALKYYRYALSYFSKDKANLPAERANTLNNLAYAQALLERLRPAKEHVNEAIAIRRELGSAYPLAFSQNTLGHILTMEDRPDKGHALCMQALETFTRLGEQRGRGLALIGAGYALRKRADQWKVSECTPEEADGYFHQGEELLTQSIEIFAASEPLSEWEARNELGSLYCDWGWLRRKGRGGDAQARRHEALELYRKSEEQQRLALTIARAKRYTYQVVDSLDDLAQLHDDLSVLLREMENQAGVERARREADEELQQVLEIIPEVYRLVPGQPVRTEPDESGTQWRAIGKVHLQYSRRIFEDLKARVVPDDQREAELTRAIREMLIAAIYFQKYQQNSFAYDRTPVRLARLLRDFDVTFPWVDAQIRDLEAAYGEDLVLVREILRDVLGI